MASLKKPETIAALDKIGFTIELRGPEAFKPYQVEEIQVWTNVAKQAGIKAGEFTIEDVPLTALAIGGLVGWAPVWYRPNGRLSKQDVAQYPAGMALNMVKAKRSKTRRSKKDLAS